MIASTYIFIKYLGAFFLSVTLIGTVDTVVKVSIMFSEAISKKQIRLLLMVYCRMGVKGKW